MAWTQGQIDALKAAIADGARVVKYQDRTVEYRSLAEMKEILGMMESEVAGRKGCGSVLYPVYDKGYGVR